jgi:CBS domain-containing protein
MTPVSAVSADRVEWISQDAGLSEVARALAAADVGLLVIRTADGGDDKPAGVVSERDVIRALAEGRDLEETTALDIAHTELAWSDATATAAEVAEEMMERYIRHVLVEEDGRLVGIVSARDLLGVYVSAETFGDE